MDARPSARVECARNPAPLVAFDPVFHLYTVNGEQVLSVTQVLRDSGLVELGQGGTGISSGVLAHKRELGRAVHAATHYFDEGDLDFATVGAEAMPYVEAYIRMRHETGFLPLLIEHRVYHPTFGYCGTVDRIGTIDRYPFGVLLDLKTGDPEHVCTNLQLAGYLDAYRAAPDGRVRTPGGAIPPQFERWAVQLRADATYRLTRYTDHRDVLVFRAALTLVQYKRHGGHV